MVSNRIRELRKVAGLTQEQLSARLGIKRATLARYEAGTIDPPTSQLRAIATTLGVSTDYLLDLTSLERDRLQYVEDYVVGQTGESRDAVHKRLIEEKISALPYDAYNDAVDAADEAVVEAFRAISDSQLQKYLQEDYRLLNRRGRIEAVMHTARLTEDYRFNRATPAQAAVDPPPPSTPTADTPGTEPPPESP